MIENKKSTKILSIFTNLILILFSALCIYPILLILAISFSDSKSIFEFGYRLIPKQFSLLAYEYIFRNPTRLVNSYMVTIFVAFVGGFISLALTAMLSYTLSRQDYKYKKQVSFYVFFTMLFNGGLVPTYMIVVNVLHLKGNILVLIMPYVMIAWNVMLLRSFFSAVPPEIMEAAEIDGSSEIKTFLRIVIPLSKPGLAAVGFLIVLRYWNDWWLSLLYIQNPKMQSLQYMLYTLMRAIDELAKDSMVSGSSGIDINFPSEAARMAMAILSIAPMLFIFPIFQKHFVKGITLGAVKG